jgi:hypothetical protein
MATIPETINGVKIYFAPGVNREVETSMLNGLTHCIRKNVSSSQYLLSVYIASASDSHIYPSRHAQKKAVDISRINGTKIVLGYPGNRTVKAIVDSIQTSFEGYKGRRENFGPYLKKKSGDAFFVKGHTDHIHLSVD